MCTQSHFYTSLSLSKTNDKMLVRCFTVTALMILHHFATGSKEDFRASSANHAADRACRRGVHLQVQSVRECGCLWLARQAHLLVANIRRMRKLHDAPGYAPSTPADAKPCQLIQQPSLWLHDNYTLNIMQLSQGQLSACDHHVICAVQSRLFQGSFIAWT